MTLTISANRLSYGAQGDDVARLQQALRALGKTIPASETSPPVMGAGTVAVVKALQQELGMATPTGIVDGGTVESINSRLANLTIDQRIVRGLVHDANGNPVMGVTVSAFSQGPAGETPAGKPATTADDGSYALSYAPPSGGRADLRLQVSTTIAASAGTTIVVLDTSPSSTSVLTNAGPLEVVDFVLSAAAVPPKTEYEQVLRDIAPLLGRRALTSLAEDAAHHDVSLLAAQSGYSTDQVAALVRANQLAKDAAVPPQVIYAWLRLGLPWNVNALQATLPDARAKALQVSVSQGLVPATVDGKKIQDYLAGFAPISAAPLQGLLAGVLPNASDQNTLIGLYLKNNQDPAAFWKQVAADPVLGVHAADLKLTVQIAALTNKHEPLVKAVKALPGVTQASDLVRITKDQWKALIQTPGVGVPTETPGATPDEKVTNYTETILTQVEAAFPTAFFAQQLPPSPVKTFLQAQAAYDLTSTYPAQFFKNNPAAASALSAQDQSQLLRYQRIYRLTGKTSEALALSTKVHSAQQIAGMDRQAFATQFKDALSPSRANEIYDQALRTHAVALALYAENGAGMNRTSMRAVPRLDTAKQAALAQDTIPDWETLFGAFDFCACEECASAHGPAAYLVDILSFLDERPGTQGKSVRDALFDRRPDLGDIELSCENTNTPVPLIDLVNEILEDAVAPPTAFAPFTLVPALESDLAQTVATAALAAAFHPPLQPGAPVEVLETGKRWRIWDEAFVYSVVKDSNTLTVTARSRQTAGSAEDRRATPQYRNRAAYNDRLSQSVYPWNLPFDLASEEARVFLTHLGVSRRDLIESLRPMPDAFDATSPVVVSMAAERLGLTDMQRKIVVGESQRQPEDFWGSATVAALTTVQELLDRSGLSYAELDALIGTWFINPAGVVSITAKPGAPVDTCDTTKLQINGLSADVLSRMHQFVRLWRALGWTITDVDRALHSLVPDHSPPVLTNEVLVRVDHLRTLAEKLRLSVAQALAFWKPLDTVEPGSLYRSLFYNPAVFRPQDDAFRLRPDGQELADVSQFLIAHVAAIQAAFRLDSASLALLLTKTDGKLNLPNLSLVYRHAVLARQLGLTVQDLLTALDLTGLSPFGVGTSQEALRFIGIVKAIQSSGFSIPQLDYLLRHRFNPPAPFVPLDSVLASTLTDLRADLLKISASSDTEKQKLPQSAVFDRVSAALSLPGDVTASLVARVMYGGESALQRFIELSDIHPATWAASTPYSLGQEIWDGSNIEVCIVPGTSGTSQPSWPSTLGSTTTDNTVTWKQIGTLPLTRDIAKPQFETLEKLLKIASIIQTLELPSSQLDWLFRENAWLSVAPDPPATPVTLDGWYSLIQFHQLRQDPNRTDGAVEAVLGALTGIAVAIGQPAQRAAKQAFVDTLTKWQGWPADDLTTLIGKPDNLGDLGLLNARLPDDYQRSLIVRLGRAMNLVKRLGVAAAQANQWCDPTVSDANAKAIRGGAKAKYDDETWRKIVTPLQNSLRDQQREALVSYLVARPAKWDPSLTKATANNLFDHFLIDVKMSSCQPTSRIKQAIGCVQLFAQRCLMGLEQGIETITDRKWMQWDWMKNFRVWEANRKIWMYPENWIEPELRDDKTPFFKDLENDLMQSDLDNAAAEQALMRYLEKLDTVSRLQIAGMYEDESKVLHVFGRTFHTPHIYYYRRREGVTQSWTPWEKLDLDISGDHLIPVMWNRKLMLIWPIFSQKQTQAPITMPAPGETLASGAPYWEIQLAWSEFQYGRWSGKNLSEPVAFYAWQGEDNILFGQWVPRPVNVMARMKNGTGTGSPPDGTVPPGGVNPPPPPATNSSNSPRQLVSPELISFRAILSEETLAVRGYLRRDYRSTPDGGDQQIAYPFGEFRFSGCRKIVTTVADPQIARRNFALAPTGTKFDRMWFSGISSGLTLFDGTFPTFPPFILPTSLTLVNEYASIAGDPSSTLASKIDIPVLDQTPSAFQPPSTFQLLAPHQDLQFTGDRPFFFEDGQRAFICHLDRRVLQLPDRSWMNGNLATAQRADFFPLPNPQPPGVPPGQAASSLTVLVPGPGGQRIAQELASVDLTPAFSPRTLLPTSVTLHRYTFANFHHPYLCEFVKALDSEGIPALMSYHMQGQADAQSFNAYGPKPIVLPPHPSDEVEFQSGGAYELYNWEVFFHIPLLIATRLSQNQRFEDAQRWFHYIFDPSGNSGSDSPQNIVQRYWNFKPFHERTSADYEVQSVKTIETMAASGPSEELKVAIEEWRSNPFSPYTVARLRTTAFQKTVVMKYIDNLIAWGDQLFRTNTLETINEATLLYVLAAEILGPRPEVIQRNLKPVVQTFNTLSPVGPLGNALEQIELLVPAAGGSASLGSSQGPDLPSDKVLYFCVTENDKLLGYWDTVARRLFKIRHCMNIEGQVQQLPLFEPPIDPALLVRARAAGMSISDVLSDIATPSLPNYRFSVMVQKAGELVAEVKNLGSQLLSVLEKRDAKALSTLRSGQELRLLQAVRDVRAKQVDEANANIAALYQSQAMAQARKDYYDNRVFESDKEIASLALSQIGVSLLGLSVAIRGPMAVLQALGRIKIGAPTTAGSEPGPAQVAEGILAVASTLDVSANAYGVKSQIVGRLAEYDRRKEEWDHQGNLATIELKQIDQQLTAAQIRFDIAEQELSNHDQQIDNARDVDQFLRSKFTNQDLFQWMIGRVSSLYFQSYQLAYDLARRAEVCMQHELGLPYGSTSIIRFGYWDSLKKGLLAGDQLSYDLKRLEVAYLDANKREYELTKHVSLVSLAPEQFLSLKETGVCEFDVPEWLFDLDTPGHYMRRLKMASLTIPCVIGPYTTIHCKLLLKKSSYRQDASGATYERTTDDTRFVDDRRVYDAIVTSTGQNDTGLFEPAMRDERYLPFEGAGAISNWRLELPTEFKTFDYGTISDVILHLRFTARSDDALRENAIRSLKSFLGNATVRPLSRLISLRHEFPTEWYRFVSSPASTVSTVTVSVDAMRFPYFVQGKKITLTLAKVIGRTESGTPPRFAVGPGPAAPDLTKAEWTGQSGPGPWTVATDADPKVVEDVFVVFAYSAS